MSLRPLLIGLAFALATHPAAAQLGADAQRDFTEYENFAPHRAFVVSQDGRATWWAGARGADPAGAVERALKACTEANRPECRLHAVNNVPISPGGDWQSLAPPRLPEIGRLRAQPFWRNQGPSTAAGLIVWSHGYLLGADATTSAPQPWVGRFTRAGYDLYRFDREYINNWPNDASQLAEAVRAAKAMGYRRVLLTGQSAGGWASVAATMRGAPVDGVVAIAPAHHGTTKNMRDTTIARSDWQQLVRGIKRGRRVAVVNFKDDDYDVGGRMKDASDAFAAAGVEGLVLDEPAGHKGHGAGNSFPFARQYRDCLFAFIETGARQGPCAGP